MARYETYQSNAAEAPIMRKWLVRGFFLSLAIHALLIIGFRLKKLEHFSMGEQERLAPPAEILTRVKISKTLDEPSAANQTTTQKKATTKLVIPDDKPKVSDVQFKAVLPEFTKPIVQDKPKADPGASQTLAKVEAASRGEMEKELNSLAGSLIKESAPSLHQPKIRTFPSDKTGNGLGSAEGIPGRKSLDDALANVGPLPSGNTAIGVPGGALYEYDSAELKPDAVEQLQKLAELIRRNPNSTFSIEGHTDSFGSQQYNMDLSLRRAESVKTWLVANMSIAPERIQTKGFGNLHPIVPAGKSVEEQAPNRRVEIIIKTGRKKG